MECTSLERNATTSSADQEIDPATADSTLRDIRPATPLIYVAHITSMQGNIIHPQLIIITYLNMITNSKVISKKNSWVITE